MLSGVCHHRNCPCCSNVCPACGSLLAELPAAGRDVGGNLFAAVTDAAMGKQFIAVPKDLHAHTHQHNEKPV